MSHEEPGDGRACDHCNLPAGSTADGRLGFLAPNRGEQLCSVCIWQAVDAEHLASGRFHREGGRIVPTYVTPRSPIGRATHELRGGR